MSGNDWGKRLTPVAAVGFCLIAIIGAFAIAYVVGALNGKQAYQRHAEPHSHAEAAKEQAKRSCLGTEAATVFECVYDKVEASEETARTEEDLVAQQRAAWAAMVGAGLGFFTMAISAIGLWFIYETLKATRAAVVEANEATDAARQAVEITKDSSQKQLRAYLAISGVEIFFIDDTRMRIDVNVVNLGATPAKIARVVRRAWVGPRGVRNPLAEGPDPGLNVMHKANLGKDQTDRVIILLKAKDFVGLNTPTTDFYVYGQIDYTDIFNEPQHVKFSYTPMGYNVTKDRPFAPCLAGNEAT